MEDLFALLGANEGCSQHEMKTRCQALLLKLHPDKNGGKECEDFRSVQKAWKLLSNGSALKQYLAERVAVPCAEEKAVWTNVSSKEMVREGDHLYYECRCGGQFRVSVDELDHDVFEDVIVECDTCSLDMRITREEDTDGNVKN